MFNFPCLHFYTLYLLLNSCNKNDVFWCYSMLVKQSSSFSRKHRTLSLQICVHRTVRLTTEFLDWCRNVCTLYKHLSVTPAAVTSDLKQRLIDTWASISQNVINEAVGQWRKWLRATVRQKDLTVNICYNWNLFFSEPPTVYQGKHVVSCLFHRSHLKANEVSKSEGTPLGTRKVEYAYCDIRRLAVSDFELGMNVIV